MDLYESNEKFDNLKKSISEKIFPISSLTNYGIKELLYGLKEKIHEIEKVNA